MLYTIGKRYEFRQAIGDQVTRIIVINPTVENGCLCAGKVADLNIIDNIPVFVSCPCVQFVAGGSWNLTEYEGDIFVEE